MNLNSLEAKKFIRRQKINKIKIFILQVLLLGIFLVTWEILSSKGIINSFLFSSPSKVFKLLKQYTLSGELYNHIFISIYETLLGLIIGTTAGILIAIILWWNKTLDKILDKLHIPKKLANVILGLYWGC